MVEAAAVPAARRAAPTPAIAPAEILPERRAFPNRYRIRQAGRERVLACVEDGGTWQLWLGFGPLPPALESALERHLFRVHRRAIAESRRPR